jgi:hypothetical protein
MDDETHPSNNGAAASPGREQARRAAMRAREVKDGALGAIIETPGWVWAVVAGVLLLMLGILAASRYRSNHRRQES